MHDKQHAADSRIPLDLHAKEIFGYQDLHPIISHFTPTFPFSKLGVQILLLLIFYKYYNALSHSFFKVVSAPSLALAFTGNDANSVERDLTCVQRSTLVTLPWS